jgi:hypothetical protein
VYVRTHFSRMREAMPVEPMQSTSHAVPARGPLEQPQGRLGLSRTQAAEYTGVGFSLFDQTVADDQHAAAIEMAISVALLPRGTAIILQTKRHHLGTDILVCEPSQTNYSILAQVDGEEVVFVDDFVTSVAESEA